MISSLRNLYHKYLYSLHYEIRFATYSCILLIKIMIFYIGNTGNKNFWTGANDIEAEGVWRWPSGDLVRHGAPLWGTFKNGG